MALCGGFKSQSATERSFLDLSGQANCFIYLLKPSQDQRIAGAEAWLDSKSQCEVVVGIVDAGLCEVGSAGIIEAG